MGRGHKFDAGKKGLKGKGANGVTRSVFMGQEKFEAALGSGSKIVK